MATFKSPELQLSGRITKVIDPEWQQVSSFYVKVSFLHGLDWQLIKGKNKFQSFQVQAIAGIAAIEQPFELHYVSKNIRGWPKILIEVWKIDHYGRHNIYGYGTTAIPMASGEHQLEIPCWRPQSTWYDRLIGANSELQYPSIVASSLNRYGLRTYSGCKLKIEIYVIGKNFQLHGIIR